MDKINLEIFGDTTIITLKLIFLYSTVSNTKRGADDDEAGIRQPVRARVRKPGTPDNEVDTDADRCVENHFPKGGSVTVYLWDSADRQKGSLRGDQEDKRRRGAIPEGIIIDGGSIFGSREDQVSLKFENFRGSSK